MSIKNIILDLGGVLFDLDYFKTEKAFEKLGLGESFSQLQQNSLFDDLEEGKISAGTFIEKLISLSRRPDLKSQEIINAWNAMLLGMPSEKFKLLQELKEKYNLYLYSNTNEIHIKAVWKHYKEVHGINDLNDFFIKVYLSNEIKIRKPKKEGFNLILKENNLLSNETVFIDDSPQHVKGALSCGIQGYWLNLTKKDLRSLLVSKGLLN
jgi:FMN phosphatase YigB (HAD superfamily)